MGFITRSGNALCALALAAMLYALGTAFLVAAYLALTPSNLGMVRGLSHASYWLRLSGGIVALIAICVAGIEAGGDRDATPGRTAPGGMVPETAEVARANRTAVAAGALLIVVGLLITAVEGRTTAGSGVVGALGFLPLGLLLLWRSNGDAAPFIAGVGTLTFSVGYAMSSNAMEVAGQVSAGLLEAVGAAAVTGSVIGARPREYLWTGAWRAPYQRSVIGGLLTLILAFVASAIVSGVVYSGNATLTDIRVGPAIAYALECAGVAMLGWAAGWRVFLANRAQHTR